MNNLHFINSISDKNKNKKPEKNGNAFDAFWTRNNCVGDLWLSK